LVYVFWEPYQKNASWAEWAWTSLAFAAIVGLATLGAVYWSKKNVMRWVCLAVAALAAVFTAYRPTGVFFFIYVAAFAPLATGGSIALTATIVAGVVALIIGEWSLLAPFSWMPYIVSGQSILIGAAITGVVRQQKGLRQILKTAERERIARDLHDILGHTLSIVILKSELASRLMAHDPQRAKAEIEEVEKISRNALAEVREAISGYRSGDLRSELDKAKSTLETAGVIVEEEYDAAGLPVSHERVLALVLREAVTNIVRHAQAKRCTIRLERDQDVYRLEVKDDGRGSVREEGMGMRGIRERVEAIGGHATWASDSGTALTITVPSVASTAGELA
jgi:two-component system sensor histidine kinase DesK